MGYNEDIVFTLGRSGLESPFGPMVHEYIPSLGRNQQFNIFPEHTCKIIYV